MSDADLTALVVMLRQIQCEPASFDTYSMASAAERAADAIERLRSPGGAREALDELHQIDQDIFSPEPSERHAWYAVEGAAEGKWQGLPVKDVICINCGKVRPLLDCLNDPTTCYRPCPEPSAKDYIARLPADWFKDSSLETWFPLTAEELKRLRMEVETLRRAPEPAGKHQVFQQEKTMMTMRAKMRVASVTKYGEPPTQVNLTFAAVGKSDGYPPDGSDENNTFAKYTPNAAIQMTIQNPALLDKFEQGQQFYVDFTPAA